MHNATPADPHGLEWTAWLTDADRYAAHRGEDRLSVWRNTRGAWCWEVERILIPPGPGASAKAGGESLSAEAAQTSAAGYRFEEFRLTHSHPWGAESLWVGATDQAGDRTHTTWTASLAGDVAQVHLSVSRYASDQPWYWYRQCAKAAAILALAGDGRLHGYEASREKAMIACIEAPDQLRRAAAMYLADCHAERGIL
jgi:hypothetical protein